MPWAKHWDIRRHIKDFREPSEDPKHKKGVEARYIILDYLILRANPRLRTFIGVDTMMADTGFAQPVVAGALAWLFDRGAIYNVPYRFRVGTEAELAPRKYVFQLTGVVHLSDKWVRYLMFSEEDAQMMLDEWRNIGMEVQVDEAFFTAKPETVEPAIPSPDEGSDLIPSLSEGSPSEGSLNGGLSSTSFSPSSTSKNQVTNGGQAAVSNLPAAHGGIGTIPSNTLSSNGEEVEQDTGKTPLHKNIIDHPLVEFFMDELGMRMLTPKLYKLFTDPIKVKVEGGILNTKRGLLDMWDTEPGFEEFCCDRIPQLLEWDTPMTEENILRHLTNFNKQDGIGGFYLWYDNEYDDEVETTPQDNSYIESLLDQQEEGWRLFSSEVDMDDL